MIYHVTPIGDLKEHEEKSTCPCEPRVEIENGHMIIIHNSYDGREAVEELTTEVLNNGKWLLNHPSK